MTNDTAFASGRFHGSARGGAEHERSSSAPTLAADRELRLDPTTARRIATAKRHPRRIATAKRHPRRTLLGGLLGVAQIAATAWTILDVAQKDERDLNGPKWFWYAASFVNWIGPAAYWLGGRKIGR